MDDQIMLLQCIRDLESGIELLAQLKANHDATTAILTRQLSINEKKHQEQLLFHETKLFAYDNGFEHVWKDDGKIFIRKDNYSAIIAVQNEFVLHNIRETVTNGRIRRT